MLMAVALFWGGRHGYKRNPPTGNVVGQVARAVMYALKRKFTTKVSTVSGFVKGWLLVKFTGQQGGFGWQSVGQNSTAQV